MFTGLVEETGRLAAFTEADGRWRLEVTAAATLEGTAVGDSIAVNGCCLTVVRIGGGRLAFDVLEETRRLTGFAALRPGARVNLERSLPAGGRIGGHFVTGHIDAAGVVDLLEARGADHQLRVRMPAGYGRYLVVKGSIAIDGVSLTVADTAAETVSVWLIPHTLAATSLGDRRPGDGVNLEFDLLAKHVEKLLGKS